MKRIHVNRILSVLLAVILSAVFLAACNGNQQGQETASGTESVSAEMSSSAEPESSAVPESTAETPESTESPEPETTGTAADESTVSGQELIEAPSISAKSFPVTDGSTATLPLSWMLYRLCTGEDQAAAEEAMHFTKTNNAYLRLMDREADLVIAYEPGPNAKENPRYEDIILKPIGLDALIFICNTGNRVDTLTTKEIRDIYTGNITNWKEIGGDDAPIIAFQREVNSGSQTLMENLMMKGTVMADAPKEFRPSEMGDLIENVAQYANSSNALGYSVYYYAQNMYTRPNLRFMAVDGVMPSNDTIRNGEYKYTNPFYVAIRKDEPTNSKAYELFEWLTGDDGQSLVEAMGYVSLVKGSKSLPDGLNGKVSISGGRLAENTHRLAVNGRCYDGDAGVVFLDASMQYMGREDSIRIRDDDAFALIRGSVFAASEPLYGSNGSSDAESEEYPSNLPVGLYDVDLGGWAVEPSYDFCYTECKDGDHAVFYLGNWTEAYDENGEYIGDDVVSSVDLYDENGKKIRSQEYTGWEELEELIADTLRHSHVHPETSEDGLTSVYRLGGSTVLTETYGEESKVVLEVGGKEYASASSGYLVPYQSDFTSEDELPYRWCIVHLFDSGLDENDDYYYDEVGRYVINDKGEVVYALPGNEDEGIDFVDRNFIITRNYDSGKFVIHDMNGVEVSSWIEPEDYEYADWWG